MRIGIKEVVYFIVMIGFIFGGFTQSDLLAQVVLSGAGFGLLGLAIYTLWKRL